MRKVNIDLSFEYVNSLFRYDDETGNLYRKTSRGGHSIGNIAGCDNGQGYCFIRINKKGYLASRIIFLLINKRWPKDLIDHIDGNPSNNKISNLREASQAENCKNCKRHKKNRSGATGVSWNKNAKKWMAYIFADGKRYYLGIFSDVNKAIAIRKQYEGKLNFHPNHGRVK